MYLLRCGECLFINHLFVLLSSHQCSLFAVSKSLLGWTIVPLQSGRFSMAAHSLRRLRGIALTVCGAKMVNIQYCRTSKSILLDRALHTTGHGVFQTLTSPAYTQYIQCFHYVALFLNLVLGPYLCWNVLLQC